MGTEALRLFRRQQRPWWAAQAELVLLVCRFAEGQDRSASLLQAARRLTARLFEMARPGGRLFIANFHPETPGSVCMEAWMDWWLIYRTETQVQDFASGIDPSNILRIASAAKIATSRIWN